MGQPKVASATWHDRNRRIFRDFYEVVGQQKLETIRAITELVGAYVKSPNCVFRDQANSFGRRKKTASFYPLWDDYDKTWLHQKRTKSGSIYSQRVARIYDDRN